MLTLVCSSCGLNGSGVGWRVHGLFAQRFEPTTLPVSNLVLVLACVFILLRSFGCLILPGLVRHHPFNLLRNPRDRGLNGAAWRWEVLTRFRAYPGGIEGFRARVRRR
jgi:hypothetical protein